MSKVVIDMTMSLNGFVAGPGDGKEYPLGKNDGVAHLRPELCASTTRVADRLFRSPALGWRVLSRI
jgi:hypothetical protein